MESAKKREEAGMPTQESLSEEKAAEVVEGRNLGEPVKMECPHKNVKQVGENSFLCLDCGQMITR